MIFITLMYRNFALTLLLSFVTRGSWHCFLPTVLPVSELIWKFLSFEGNFVLHKKLSMIMLISREMNVE